MADINKFQRSKERMTEILKYHLINTRGNEKQENPYLVALEQSIQLIDGKIEELQKAQGQESQGAA